MTEREKLVRKILEDPYDLVARLVFSDWLEESGEQEYAEFVRGKRVLGPRGTKNVYRPKKSWYPKAFNWKGKGEWSYTTSYGFIESVGCRWWEVNDFKKHVGDLFSTHPITSVRIFREEPVEFYPPQSTEYGTDHGYIFLELGDRNWAWRHELPNDIFELLEGDGLYRYGHGGARTKGHASKEEIMKRLSHALVKWGRKQAGLPEIEIK